MNYKKRTVFLVRVKKLWSDHMPGLFFSACLDMGLHKLERKSTVWTSLPQLF